jgi:cellulose synthase/poly-beta-1,6-N-acetylglucosamine synthase-like glycosyltransferase
MKKISFIVPIHNEDKILFDTLNSLNNIPYDNYEVLLGLDGCTDNSSALCNIAAQQNNKFKVFDFKERHGKNILVDQLINQSTGDIIIIHDTDWQLDFKSKEKLNRMISLFNNNDIGGIAESFPITWPIKESDSLMKAGITVHGKMWIDYIKEKGIPIGDWIILNRNEFPLLVNIFRKDVYKPSSTLADDFERCIDIFKQGKLVLATNNESLPRMISNGKEEYTFSGLLKQKERTAIAREQLQFKLEGRSLSKGELFKYILDHLKDYNNKERRGFNWVSLIFILGTIKSKLSPKKTTKEGWTMRNR